MQSLKQMQKHIFKPINGVAQLDKLSIVYHFRRIAFYILFSKQNYFERQQKYQHQQREYIW